jgi:hypothetical protein
MIHNGFELIQTTIKKDEKGRQKLFFRVQNRGDVLIKSFQICLHIEGERTRKIHYDFRDLDIRPDDYYAKWIRIKNPPLGEWKYRIELIDIVTSEDDASVESQVEYFYNALERSALEGELRLIDQLPIDRIRRAGMVLSAAIVLAFIIFMSMRGYSRANEYKLAMENMNNGNWDLAYSEFCELGGYKDSEKYVDEIEDKENIYSKALMYTNRGEWEIAAKLLLGVSGYKNADALYSENPAVLKGRAEKLIFEKNYTEALDIYQKINQNLNVEIEFELIKKKANEDYLDFFKLIRAGEFENVQRKYSKFKYLDAGIIMAMVDAKLYFEQNISNLQEGEFPTAEQIEYLNSCIARIPEDYAGDLKDMVVGQKLKIQNSLAKYSE